MFRVCRLLLCPYQPTRALTFLKVSYTKSATIIYDNLRSSDTSTSSEGQKVFFGWYQYKNSVVNEDYVTRYRPFHSERRSSKPRLAQFVELNFKPLSSNNK